MYDQLFTQLKALQPAINPERIVMDYKLAAMGAVQHVFADEYICFHKRDMSESDYSLGAWSSERLVLQSELSPADRSLSERSSWALCPERIVPGRSVSGRTVRIPLTHCS